MENHDILRPRGWTEQELLEAGFKYYRRRKRLVMARQLPAEEAPLEMYYGEDTLIAKSGYMICFNPTGWFKKKSLYEYDHWPVDPDHFADTYVPWDEPWKPTRVQRHLLSLDCKPYYNAVGVWAKRLEKPQMIQGPEHRAPFEVPKGAWLIIGSKGSTLGVPWWGMDKGFRNNYIID